MEIFQVDAFADRPSGGNPAAVCIVGADADPHWMQSVAAEMNLRARHAGLGPRAVGTSRRGGRVGVARSGDRVLLAGRAVTVLRGELV